MLCSVYCPNSIFNPTLEFIYEYGKTDVALEKNLRAWAWHSFQLKEWQCACVRPIPTCIELSSSSFCLRSVTGLSFLDMTWRWKGDRRHLVTQRENLGIEKEKNWRWHCIAIDIEWKVNLQQLTQRLTLIWLSGRLWNKTNVGSLTAPQSPQLWSALWFC